MDKDFEILLAEAIKEIKNELVFRHGSGYYGNVEFRFNFVAGGIAGGMNVASNKTVKLK